ncbi:glycosyltransferase family 9 protein [bacterium]|nr:glycosyltransferase family 9 protein [bacterium]
MEEKLLAPNSPLLRAKTLIFVRLDGLGDSLLATPCIAHLKEQCPHLKVVVVASPLGAPVFRDLAEVVIVDPKSEDCPQEIYQTIIENKADIVISFTEKRYVFQAMKRANSTFRVGFTPGIGQPLKSLELLWELNHRVDGRVNCHEVERFFLLLEELGLKRPSVIPQLTFHPNSKEVREAREKFLQITNDTEKKICAIQLMPRWHIDLSNNANDKTSEQLQNNLQVVSYLYKKLREKDIMPVFTCAPNDRMWAERFLSTLEEAKLFVSDNIGLFVAFLQNCHLFVTPDGGSAHLCACAKTPQIVIFSRDFSKSESIEYRSTRWHPWGSPYKIVADPGKNTAYRWQDDLLNACLEQIF